MNYVINITDNKIEAIYEGELHAELICRNFRAQFPQKQFEIMTESNQISERPTDSQLFRIRQIENGCNIPFIHYTKKAASKFLDKHISKTKKFDEEYFRVKNS